MIPALFDVGHKQYTEGVEDAHGNVTPGWLPPVTKKFVTFATFTADEPAIAGHSRDEVDCGIIVYPDFGPVNPMDRMVIDGQEYEVVGVPERNDKAWWDCSIRNWVIGLKQVNG